MATTVGRFIYEDGTLTGPAEYMRERGDARLAKIVAGEDVVFNFGAMSGRGDTITLVLVSLQTDYAGWLGTRELLSRGSV